MGAMTGDLLHSYLCPLAGLSLLGVGTWSSWVVWKPGLRPPALASRVASLLLGCLWGWILTQVAYPVDPAHVAIGFPMPVAVLARGPGRSLVMDSTLSLPCLGLNLAIGIGLANAGLHLIWKRKSVRHRYR